MLETSIGSDMAQDTPATSPSLAEPPPSFQSTLSESQAKAFVELKELCSKNNLYWPASELEHHDPCGYNNDTDLL